LQVIHLCKNQKPPSGWTATRALTTPLPSSMQGIPKISAC